jgi:hypothetical protein
MNTKSQEQESTGRPPQERAEEMVDHAGERVGTMASALGHRLQVFIARAREEAEDILAEAQNMRRGGQT